MLLWSYITIYVLVFAGVHLADSLIVPAEERDPPWERIVDGVLVSLGLVGMILFAKGVPSSAVAAAWRPVAVGVVLGQGVLFVRYLRDRRQLVANAAGSVTPTEVLLVDTCTSAMLIPSLVINLRYAFS